MDETSPPAPRPVPPKPSGKAPRRGFPPSSIVLFALAVVLGVLAVLLATGTIGRSTPPPPPPTPGSLYQIDVVNALRAQGLATEVDPRLFVPRRAFSQPGQGVRVEGEPLYAFFFADPARAREEFEAVNPAEVLPPPPGSGSGSGSPEALGAEPVGVMGGAPFLVQGSNVVVAMPGGDEETRTKVRAAIEGLP